MKKYVKFILSALICGGLTCLLSNPIPQTKIPALGPLLSPFTGFWQNSGEEETEEEILLENKKLEKPVRIIFGDRRVPHIFAESNKDAFFAQGYLLAKNRLWQMDIATRSAGGRLSEVMGERLLKRDKLQRRRGMVFAAENAISAWRETPEFAYVEAYTNGVNAYLAQLSPADYPIEYKLINYAPEPWTPLKTALFNKAMAETLSSGDQDLEMTNLIKLLGDSIVAELYPDTFSDQSPIIPNEVSYDFQPVAVPASTSTPLSIIDHRAYAKHPPFLGSNNWAVSGSKTASGYPILCNDPHLGLTLPSTWYELQIKTPEMNAYGVCLPGVPGIVIGFNENTAWGVTNVGHDVVDWYKIKWADDDKKTYWLDGKKEETKIKIEKYEVLGIGTVYDTVHYTHWGPVVYEDAGHPEQDLAMRWMAHDPAGNELKTFMGLNTSANYTDYRKAITNFASPAQNIVFADKEGNIGITVQGRLPLRSKGQGLTVQSGETRNNEWGGQIPMEQLPHVKNPERGFVASANQKSTGLNYPYYYHSMRGGFEAYRGRTLNQKLSSMNQITVDDMKALQTDVYGLKAAEALPGLIALMSSEALDETGKKYLSILKTWNFEYEGKAAGPILFNEWYRNFYKKTWDEIYKLDETADVAFPQNRQTIKMLNTKPDHPFFDDQSTTKIETAREIALISFKMMQEKISKWEQEGKPFEWSAYKKLDINHIGFIPAFSRTDLKVEGDSKALNAIGRTWGPSWRMIVAFGPGKPKAYGIYPGGQSGHPGSRFYDNMLEDWAEGRYYELELMDD